MSESERPDGYVFEIRTYPAKWKNDGEGHSWLQPMKGSVSVRTCEMAMTLLQNNDLVQAMLDMQKNKTWNHMRREELKEALFEAFMKVPPKKRA